MKINRSQAGGLLAALVLTVILSGCRKQPPPSDADLQSALHTSVANATPPASLEPGRLAMVQSVYQGRNYLPIWSGLNRLKVPGQQLVTALTTAESQGLRSSDYDLPGIRQALIHAYGKTTAQDSIPAAVAALELRLTSTFLQYGSHLYSGRLDPATVDTAWFITARRTGVDSALRTALQAKTFPEMVAPLPPRQPQYTELTQALGQYRALQARGGWPTVPIPPKVGIKPGQTDTLVPLVRRRLTITGELGDSLTIDPARYDSALAGAVARFQELHGLETDSIIGRTTLEAMNIPVDVRVGQIELNMERYRWLPDDLGPRYVLVNVPDYHLVAYEDGKQVFSMRVVVGKDYENPTPVFADTMSYIIFRPYWNVPIRIIKQEIIPEQKKDTSYISKHDYQIMRGRDSVEPSSINWKKVDTTNFHFLIRQKPGPLNSLGTIKFMFPNQFDVYLHDTPARGLFRRAGRAASHGCIRVEQPEKLAAFALAQNPTWDLKKIHDAMTSKDPPEQVGLRQKVPVYIVYFTAFVQERAVRFRNDLYGTDQRAIARLRQGGSPPVNPQLSAELAALAAESRPR
jgi:murein L,D-transpeptidase YcbB/YkuD